MSGKLRNFDGLTIRFIRACLLSATLGLCVDAVAQDTEDIRWTLDQFQSTCIPLWPVEATEGGEGCTVAQFDEFAELDETKFYYARYHDRSRPPVSDGFGYVNTRFNAVIIIRADQIDRNMGAVVRVIKQPVDSWDEEFYPPSLIQTRDGPVMYVQGWGMGNSGIQFLRDRYFLWKSDTWTEIDAGGWSGDRQLQADVQEALPDGLSIDGLWLFTVWDFASSFPTMTYESPVWLDTDPRCCPSGGSIRLYFELVDRRLQVSHFEYFPDGEVPN